jgi:hypothetical protein
VSLVTVSTPQLCCIPRIAWDKGRCISFTDIVSLASWMFIYVYVEQVQFSYFFFTVIF